MCFSATASFSSGAVLFAIGVVTIKKTKTTPQLFLASIPLVFSTQQLSEGVLWLSMTNAAYASFHNAAMYAFLVFAKVVWPILVPLAILLLETEPQRKKILKAFFAVGVLTGGYLLYSLLFYKVEAFVDTHHIRYRQDFPFKAVALSGILYFIPTVFSSFVSSVKSMKLFGGVLLASYLFTKVFYLTFHIISVWCFFAAILSMVILYIIIRINKHPNSKTKEHLAQAI